MKDYDDILARYFGITDVIGGEEESFDAPNDARFWVYNFTNQRGDSYKLARYDGDFQARVDLVTFMQDVEYAAVKEYILVTPPEALKGYTLYQLVPYTVKGEPQWY